MNTKIDQKMHCLTRRGGGEGSSKYLEQHTEQAVSETDGADGNGPALYRQIESTRI